MKSLHLATPEDAPKLLALVAAFHGEMGFDTDDAHRAAAITPLLDGSPHGAVWLVGPRKAPVGYVVVTFGWSVEFGGLDGIVDELYIRPAVRSRGMGTEAITSLVKAMQDAGLKALHLEARSGDTTLHKFYTRARFKVRDGYTLMSRIL